MAYRLGIIIIFILVDNIGSFVMKPSCAKDVNVCEFNFNVAKNQTMLHFTGPTAEIVRPVIISKYGLYARNTDCVSSFKLSEKELSEVNTGDGTYKEVILINGRLPGPPIVVYEGQQVVVYVKNSMINEAMTMHWHGVEQRGTPWMDGAGSISHCSISPGEIFTYRFIASPVGTRWYHTHLGTQRTMGAAGPFIVLPRAEEDLIKARAADPLPQFEEEFILMIQDWQTEDSEAVYMRDLFNINRFSCGYDKPCFNTSRKVDGTATEITPFISAIINGRGRRYDKKTNEANSLHLPLTKFHVKKNKKYRFRAINSGMTTPFRISIDDHPIHMIATDGCDVNTVPVESFIIYSGERYDFWIQTDDSKHEKNYWIRADTLQFFDPNGMRQIQGHVEAILRYKGGPDTDPVSQRRTCTSYHPCSVLNCPYQHYPDSEHTKCIPVTDLRTPTQNPTHGNGGQEITERFIRFDRYRFRKTGAIRLNVNGRVFKPPSSPLQLYQDHQRVTKCDNEECDYIGCLCTNIMQLPLGHVVQLVLVNGETIDHPIHLHGSSFQVLKIGYPLYNESHKYVGHNPDINCLTNTCSRLTWKNRHSVRLTRQGAPLKDTVLLPPGGYVVIRFVADNPGFWYMHCHMEFHNNQGLSLVLQVGDVTDMNAPPTHLYRCGDSNWTSDQFWEGLQGKHHLQLNSLETPSTSSLGVDPFYKTLTIVFAVTTGILLLASIIIYVRFKPYHGYSRV